LQPLRLLCTGFPPRSFRRSTFLSDQPLDPLAFLFCLFFPDRFSSPGRLHPCFSLFSSCLIRSLPQSLLRDSSHCGTVRLETLVAYPVGLVKFLILVALGFVAYHTGRRLLRRP